MLGGIDAILRGHVREAAARGIMAVFKPAKLAKYGDKIRKLFKKGCSFVAGTLVATPEGLKAIEELQPGDEVLARDEATGEVEAKRIRAVFANEHEEVLLLIIRQPDGDEEIIITTREHPFYANEAGWTNAGALSEGEVLLDLDGSPLYVVSTQVVAQASVAYNFDVAGFHTYAVGESRAWVHNACEKKSKRFSKEKQDLVEMAKQDKRKGITADDMEAYKDLNKELPDPFPSNKVRGPELHPNSTYGKEPHGHVGPVDHIPIIKE